MHVPLSQLPVKSVKRKNVLVRYGTGIIAGISAVSAGSGSGSGVGVIRCKNEFSHEREKARTDPFIYCGRQK